MKFTPTKRWISAAGVFAFCAAWAFWAAWVIINSGDYMIGFHPAILLSLPFIVMGAGAAILLFAWRQWQLGLGLVAGVMALVMVIYHGHAIEVDAWRRAVVLHAETNERALAAISNELPAGEIWDDEKLSPVNGFQWYVTNHISAPDGVYLGFKIAGVPHVRIQKIRHGWRGIALVASDLEFANLNEQKSGLAYSRVGSSHWYIWGWPP